ncbi:Uma2 family endonuclease [Gloeobacter morelensis]|uniref:Uma2 family endonuclease n=1 Tax=Gloeobacter morelensis MG652769 TaxID=2781736 RepID=A0ABY3PT03_9CYAN|nr:Uma2 family endonuclease [Gloeobacter morelensis]UFP96644.1 Uma2 family endonuclease [Gloeobacter morelensis MG652769]
MLITADNPFYSPEEYLQIEEHSPIKHEYVDGKLYAMVGSTQDHNLVVLNLAFALRRHLHETGCRVLTSDVKVRVEQRNRFFYPDIAVSCDERDRTTPLYLRLPRLIVEVLSDSTEAFDREAKFQDYQTIDTLSEYVLVSSKQPQVECFRRNAEEPWVLQSYRQEVFEISALNFSGTFAELYDDVAFLA